ncbi:hypothetical protein FOA52_003563 [Chlamydomonas sp. UWO 241]|nr:hypothetical protein FOA52_003563 [Chlamydomonas sp. UWO 241]
MATGTDIKDWQSLLHQTNDLVAQDFQNFPKVDRNIQQLQHYASSLRAKTNKFRSLNNQIAATRLLAQQGFDATRLNQDVTTLEIQPTIEDVFHADTSSVEDYLKQVEEATILAAIQEAQQDTVTSFEHFMEDCMVRDWAANKRQLFGLIAPHSSGAGAAPIRGLGGGGNGSSAGGGLSRLPPKEGAYVGVIAAANAAASSSSASFNLVREFGIACKANEDKAHETVMSNCWALLGDILGEVKARGVGPSNGGRFIDALLTGARKHLERGHAQHTRNLLLRHKLQAERGADPEQLREVQAYIQVKYGGRGPLDFQQPGGHDTSLIQAQAQQIASLVDVVSLLVSRVPGAPMQMPHAEPARARAGHAAHSAAPRAAPAAEAAQPARPAAAAAPVASAGGGPATERPASGATRAASARGPSRRGGLPARVGDTSLRRSFVLSIPVARGANWFLAGGGRRMDEEEATAAAAERIAAAAEDGTSLPVRLATDVVRFLYGGTGRREPADGGVVSASLLNAKPAVGGIGVEPRGGGVLRVLFTVASDAVADTVVRWRHELRRCVDSTAVFDVLSDREEAQHQALWPAFLAAKVAGKRAQFHRARLVVDGERVCAGLRTLEAAVPGLWRLPLLSACKEPIWRLWVFLCLRNGWHDAARAASERVSDLPRVGESGFRGLLEEWLRNGGRLGDRSAGALARECERLLRDKVALKGQLRYPYLVLLCAMLAGDNRTVDALTATLASLSIPPVLSTIEDFMWAKLSLVDATGEGGVQAGGSTFSVYGGSSGIAPYLLTDLHADLNRWPAAYYSKQGKEPLLYVTVLLLSLQFTAALKFLWKDETTKMYRVDAVHLAIAMHQEQALVASPGDASVDVGGMIQSYGRKFVHSDSSVALQYYMLSSVVRGNSIAVKGQMLRELLTESRDFGTLLGGGGAAGAGTLAAYVPSVDERKRLFEAVAYECQVAAQPEEAIELYMAADRPRQALSILNQQLSSAMDRGLEGGAAAGAADVVARVSTRGRDACARIGPAADAGSRREVEAFGQLSSIWELLVCVRSRRSDLASQKLTELSFIPLEKGRVEGCVRAAGSLLPPVQDRLQDVLAAGADVIAAQRPGASRDKAYVLRLQLEALCMFANGMTHRVSKAVYQRLCEVVASFSFGHSTPLMTVGPTTPVMRVFLDIDIGDAEAWRAATQRHERAQAFLEACGAQYGIMGDRVEALDDEAAAMLLEAYAADKGWSAKGDATAVKPTPLRAGRIVCELFADECPKTVENFRCLCTGEKGLGKASKKPLHLAGVKFHRIVKGFCCQGGDVVKGDGSSGDSIYNGKFNDEKAGLQRKHDAAGLLSMANSGKNSNTSQFFFALAPAPQCDGKHVVFGRVVAGLDIVARIDAEAATVDGTPKMDAQRHAMAGREAHNDGHDKGDAGVEGVMQGPGNQEIDSMCRNQTGYIGVRQRKWGMFAAEIRDGDKRRWLGSFPTGRDAGMAYDSAAISQKGSKAKTNFEYLDFSSIPRKDAGTEPKVRWDLLPKEIAERFPVPQDPFGNGARLEEGFHDAGGGAAGGGAAGSGAAGGGGGAIVIPVAVPARGGTRAAAAAAAAAGGGSGTRRAAVAAAAAGVAAAAAAGEHDYGGSGDGGAGQVGGVGKRGKRAAGASSRYAGYPSMDHAPCGAGAMDDDAAAVARMSAMAGMAAMYNPYAQFMNTNPYAAASGAMMGGSGGSELGHHGHGYSSEEYAQLAAYQQAQQAHFAMLASMQAGFGYAPDMASMAAAAAAGGSGGSGGGGGGGMGGPKRSKRTVAAKYEAAGGDAGSDGDGRDDQAGGAGARNRGGGGGGGSGRDAHGRYAPNPLAGYAASGDFMSPQYQLAAAASLGQQYNFPTMAGFSGRGSGGHTATGGNKASRRSPSHHGSPAPGGGSGGGDGDAAGPSTTRRGGRRGERTTRDSVPAAGGDGNVTGGGWDVSPAPGGGGGMTGYDTSGGGGMAGMVGGMGGGMFNPYEHMAASMYGGMGMFNVNPQYAAAMAAAAAHHGMQGYQASTPGPTTGATVVRPRAMHAKPGDGGGGGGGMLSAEAMAAAHMQHYGMGMYPHAGMYGAYAGMGGGVGMGGGIGGMGGGIGGMGGAGGGTEGEYDDDDDGGEEEREEEGGEE